MKIFRIFFLFCAFGQYAAAQDASIAVTKEQDREIRRLIRVTGMEKLLAQIIEQMLASMQTRMTGVPDAYWRIARDEMKVEDAITAFLPLYAKYYSADDLRAINDFYETPAGQRLLKSMPQLMKESMAIGEKWGQEAGQRAVKRIEAEREAQRVKTSAAKEKF